MRKLTSSQANSALDRLGSGLKNYGKNVVGGAKIVGGVVKKGIQYAASPLVKELKMQEEADRKYRKEGNRFK